MKEQYASEIETPIFKEGDVVLIQTPERFRRKIKKDLQLWDKIASKTSLWFVDITFCM